MKVSILAVILLALSWGVGERLEWKTGILMPWIVGLIFFIPAGFAIFRKKKNAPAIMVLNVAGFVPAWIGLTSMLDDYFLIGLCFVAAAAAMWVFCLVWSLLHEPHLT